MKLNLAEEGGRVVRQMRVLVYLYLIIILSGAIRAEGGDAVVVGSGAFNVLDVHSAGMGSFEYHLNSGMKRLNPYGGIMLTTNVDLYLYAGASYLFPLYNKLALAISFAPGFYYNNRKDDLGYFIEFSSGLELSYEREDGKRFILSLNHISNGRLANYNPGAETVRISYCIPLGSRAEKEK